MTEQLGISLVWGGNGKYYANASVGESSGSLG
jgi:hypothetical protein